MKIVFLLLLTVLVHAEALKIGVMSASSVIGKYSKQCYDVSLATLLSYHTPIELVAYALNDESETSIQTALDQIKRDGIDAIIAPLTLQGAKNLLKTGTTYTVFLPTVHKRDVGNAAENFIFGAIDYRAQLEALIPYSESSLAVFYSDSILGSALNDTTKEVATNRKGNLSVSSYPVDLQGSKIVTYMGKPAQFSKKSVISHLPIVKTSMLLSQMTFNGVKEKNILSTQINYDPYLLTLTQYNDRKNMIIANSIIEQVPSIYESNAFLNQDLTYEWILYTTSVGIDTLVAHLSGGSRQYSFRIIDSQVIYPIELVRPGINSFESISTK